MKKHHDAAAIGALLRRRGLPAQPVVGIPQSEVRSDNFLGSIPTLEAGSHASALSALLIQWHFNVPYDKMPELIQFVTDNDAFIAEGCKKAMDGVSYFGTYCSAAGDRVSFRTIWGYSSWAAYDEWSKIVATAGTPSSRLYDLVSQLRSYSLLDPNCKHEHLAFAGGIDIAAHPFLSLTIAAITKI